MGNDEFHREVYSLELFFCNSKYSGGIRIPAIQREYVQGREDDKGKEIRSNFIPKLVDAVFGIKKKDVGTGVFALDFIYGVRDENTQAFLVLDGQQRLTTLFLLAWACGLVDGESWRFDYEARRYAQMFLRGLIAHKCDWGKGKGIREQIIDSDWFLPIWEEDVTVAGMMNILVTIEQNIARVCGEDVDKVKKANFKNVEFAVEDIPGDEAGFNRIFLKMNSRGRQLSSWENMKAVLDQYVPGPLRDAWRRDVDIVWVEYIWEKVVSNIMYLDRAMEKVVRLAYCQWQSGFADKEPIGNCFLDPLYVVEMRLEKVDKKERANFYILARQYFEALCLGSIATTWTGNRTNNSLWQCDMPEELCSYDENEFWNWLIDGEEANFSDQLRFAFLAQAYNKKCDNRRIRVLLNLLDASSASLGRDGARYSQMLKAGLEFLDAGESIEGLANLRLFEESQVNDELAKWSCDELAIVQIEKDDLVWHGSTAFVNGSLYKTAKDLDQLISSIREKIRKDGVSFYLRILQGVARNKDDTFKGEGFAVAHADSSEKYWGEKLLSDCRFALSVSGYLAGKIPSAMPRWLKHISEIALNHSDKFNQLNQLVRKRGWLWLVGNKYLTNSAIRLDWSDAECKHRRDLLRVDYLTYDDNNWLRQGLDGNWYAITDADPGWYEEGKEPIPRDSFGKKIE